MSKFYKILILMGLIIVFIIVGGNAVETKQERRAILIEISTTCLEAGYSDFQAIERDTNVFDAWCLNPQGDLYPLGVYDVNRIPK